MDINLIASKINEINNKINNKGKKDVFVISTLFYNILTKNTQGESDAFTYYNTGVKTIDQFKNILNNYVSISDISINSSKIKGHTFYSIDIKGRSTDKYKQEVKERYKL